MGEGAGKVHGLSHYQASPARPSNEINLLKPTGYVMHKQV